MARFGAPRRVVAVAVVTALAAAGTVISAGTAAAAVVRPFSLGFSQELYGDFIKIGNGNSRCPNANDPAVFQPNANCTPAQNRTNTTSNGLNDFFYMRWADVDTDAATYNSSRSSLTIPAGATVRFARLNWSGDTSVTRDANGVISPIPACSSNQYNAGAGTAIVPSGTPETTSVRLTVGSAPTAAVAPAVITRDQLVDVPATQPQFYAAHADVTARFAGAPTGTPLPITVGNIWTPQGFGCYAGWSLVLVYSFDAPTPAAPAKRAVYMYDGHVRQSSIDPPTTTTITDFRAASNAGRVGLTAYEGDFNIVGDQFRINGTVVTDPLAPAATNNFFVSNADGRTAPTPPNNMSVDAKTINTTLIAAGSTSAQLTFSTSGDTYLAQNVVFSVPVPSIEITKTLVAPGPYRPGQPVTYQITVVSPGGTSAANVNVADPLVSDCARALGNLASNTPVTYTCTGPAPADDFTNVATVTARDPFGDILTDTDDADVVVITPAIEITKTADKANYAPGETITFTIVVTNTGDATLTGVAVTDPTVPGCATTRPSLAPSGSFTYTCTATAPIADDENTATVTATDPLGATVTDSDTAPAPTVGVVSGRVFADRDNDGAADPDDTGIGGVTVTLTGTTASGAPLSLTTTTAADGSYSFANVPAGDYRIAETQPADYDDGIDTPGTLAAPDGNDAFTLTLAQGDSSTGNNFAELPASSLAGVVFEDLDNDGAQDPGEPGIPGTTVTLTGTDDGGNPVTLTIQTGPNGAYLFDALRAGDYTVTETQPAGYADGTDTPGTAGGDASANDVVSAIALPARTDATGYTFGEFRPSSIAGRVVYDAGNPIAGVEVTLTGPGDPVTAVTDADGNYTFPGLPPGTYTVTETQPAGYADGPDTLGSAGGDDTVNDVFSAIVLPSGTTATGYDFAEDRGSIAGVVYEDTNNNGVQDPDEPGIPGATVTLTGTDARGNEVTRTTESAPDGTYRFDGVVGGAYTLTETQPAAYLDGLDTPGTAGGTATPPDSITAIALDPGEDATGYLFGEFMAGSIAGRVVDDAGNPIPGVEVTLTGPGDPVTVVTDAEGNYVFPGLPPGTYTVTETQPPGYADGPETVGSAGGDPSVNDVISGIVIGSGTEATGYIFAEDRGSLTGAVYEDLNGNGSRDVGEPGIPNVTVTLTGTDAAGDPVEITTTTDAEGNYSFSDLLGGTYTVTETQPDGYVDGADTPGSEGGTATPPDSITAISLPNGADATDYLFGEFVAGSISGRVVDDAGNPIPGVEVTLTGPGDPVTVVTDAEGNYTFPSLLPGTYTVTETQPPGYGDGPETVGSAGGDSSVNDVISGIVIGSGTEATGYIFAEDRGSLSGAVYEDVNSNGIRDEDEPGIPAVTVTLTGTDTAGNPVDITTITDANGNYTFPGLLGGTYTVTETQPDAYLDGTDAAGSEGGTVTPPDSITAIALPNGADATDYLFGEYVAGSISGRVVDDAGNPIPGVEVTLTGPGDPVTVVTDAEGNYVFPGLPPGTYTVTETQPPGYGDGPETVGSAGGDPSVNDVISNIVIGSGTQAAGYIFAEDRGSLAGAVYEDLNGNGTRDDGEPGIPDVTVTLSGTDAAGDPVEITTITDAEGNYSFSDLLGGTYTVTETQPDGYVDGTDAPGSEGGTATPPDSITAITLPNGADATDYLFGEYVAGSISGRVVDDAGNPIPGVEILLTGPGDPVIVVTDAEGNYVFSGLPPGTYTVTETQPPGYGDGPETVGSAGGDPSVNDVISNIVIGSGTEATGYIFAENGGSLTGAVYEDLNGNGTRDDGEPGIPGVTVTLSGTDAAGDPVEITTITDADGNYSFSDLLGGTYTVTETQPDGYIDGADTPGSEGGTATSPDSITAITLPNGADATDYLFGEYVAGSISGRVVDDAGNPIPGVEVTLTGPGDPVTVVTDAEGNYVFPGLPPGTYTVTETQPPGYGDGPETVGTAGGDPSVNDVISGIVIGSGTEATGYIFAEDRGSLAGVVYEDLNGNGARDEGEPGIPDVTVTLSGTDAAGDPVEITTITDAEGNYSFSDLLGGTYTVTETQPDAYVDGTDAAGSEGGTVTPPDSITAIALPAGADATGYLFGEYVAGSISGRVVDDAGNPIPGVEVTLTGPGDLVTVVTDAEGNYVFPGLPPGTYTVTETQPPGFGDGPETPGSAGGDPSVNDVISGIVIDSGTEATGYIFAENRGSLTGVVYEDVNSNGIRDEGEPGIPGATVTLTGTDAAGDPVEATATTDDQGVYTFPGLLGGTYTVTETQPAGYIDGTDAAGSEGGTVTPPDSITEIALPNGADATGYLFGEFVAGSISGRVVDDAGNPIPGVEVTLTGPGDPVTVVTDTEGNYLFPGLPPGTYTVTETQPPGYADGPETVGSAGGDPSVNDVISGIVIGSGTQATGYLFAEDRGSLTGVVYEDVNNNGIRDDGEPGIPGATVALTGTNAAGDPVEATVTTDDQGVYTFPGLLGGTYTVTETQPAGYLDGTDAAGSEGGTVSPPDSITAITLPNGADATGYLFGEFVAGSISGRVVDDAGNPIPGVEVTLTGPGDPVTVVTDAEGNYVFPGLPPGTYTVTETQPPGYADGPETPGSAGGDPSVNDVISDIVIVSGTEATGYIFAEDRGSLAGVVYEDVNGNGSRDDGEPGIPGVTVTLTGTDAAGDPVEATVITDAEGVYTFPGLLGGTYTVTETQPDGYLDGTDAPGSEGGTATPPDSITAITLPDGADATDYLFGEYVAGSISGRVVDDAGNPIPGVEITLTGPGDPVTVVTDAEGDYTFPGLPPGTYTVTETQPDGYGDGPDIPGTEGGDPSINDVISNIVIGSGTDATGYVFAEDRGSLTGVVYEDVNGNGTRDDGEPGLPDVTVTLTGTDALGNPVEITATTDDQGTYTFPDLVGGTYTLTETQPTGYLDGADTAGSEGGTPAEPDTITGVELPGGVDATDYLFGEYKAASISGQVVDDAGNPIPGVEVTLTGPGDPVTAVTDENGNYTFPNLPPGTYTVTETQPDGYGDGPETPGTEGGDPSVNDVISGIVIESGTEATGYNFAEDRGSLTGVVYEDRNNNGAQDPGEPGIGGVTVAVTGTDALGRPVERTAVTAPDGTYLVDGLVGGTYTVSETQPDGYADGTDTPGDAGGTPVPPDAIAEVALGGGQDATGYLFGERAGAITGTVWVDRNGDGVIDPDEPGRLGGVTIVLIGPDGTEIARTTTNETGGYTFPDLQSGNYTVRELQPDAYGSTTPNERPVTVPPGGGATADFGEQQGLIGDRVFTDTDRDGIQDFGEPGVPGVTVVLLNENGDQVATTTTDADGRYRFTDVPPGTYRVQVNAPDGTTFTTPNATDDPEDSDVDRTTGISGPITIEITDGRITQTLDVDAGLVPAIVDLAVDLTVDRPTATVGDTITFTDKVTNTGTVPVNGAVTVITVPAGLTITNATGDGWTCTISGQTATCTTDTILQPGDSAPPITVVTKATKPLTTTNATATVTPGDGTPDANPDNDRDSTPITVTAPGTTPPGTTPPSTTPPGNLPNTGTEVLTLLYGALALLALGMALIRSARRKWTN